MKTIETVEKVLGERDIVAKLPTNGHNQSPEVRLEVDLPETPNG
jgi:hypothetical protein